MLVSGLFFGKCDAYHCAEGWENQRTVVRGGGPPFKADERSKQNPDGHHMQAHKWRSLVARGAVRPTEGPWLKQEI